MVLVRQGGSVRAHNALLFLISSEKSLAGVDPDEITFICSVANVQCWPNRALGRAQEVA